MLKRGSNFIPLVLDTRLLVALNGKASAKNQLNATYIMALLVEHCRNDLDPNVYEELKERYKKTIVEQYAEKQAKEKERLEMERRELEIKERELGIREQNAQAHQDAVSGKSRIEFPKDFPEDLKEICVKAKASKIHDFPDRYKIAVPNESLAWFENYPNAVLEGQDNPTVYVIIPKGEKVVKIA